MNTQERRARRQRRGVTLIEVLIVVAIMALVSAGVAVAALRYYAIAKERTARTDALAVREAVKAWWFMNESTACPTMTELVTAGVLDATSPSKDPWEYRGTSSAPERRRACRRMDRTARPERPTTFVCHRRRVERTGLLVRRRADVGRSRGVEHDCTGRSWSDTAWAG